MNDSTRTPLPAGRARRRRERDPCGSGGRIEAAGGRFAPLDADAVQAIEHAALVQRCLAGLPRAVVLCGQDPRHDLMLAGARVHVDSGGGEQALLTAARVQMARHFDLPNSTIAGATDSKIADAQARYEKAPNVTLAAQAGCNFITQACGMQASLMAALPTPMGPEIQAALRSGFDIRVEPQAMRAA